MYYYFAIMCFVCFKKKFFFLFPAFLLLGYVMSTRGKLHEGVHLGSCGHEGTPPGTGG